MPQVLITGTNRGIGLALTRHYLADGWSVIGTARRPSADLDALRDRYRDRFSLHRLDVTDFEAIETLGAQLSAVAIDVLLLSAGTMGRTDFAARGLETGGFGQSDYADWEQVLRTNVLAPMKFAEVFVEHVARSSQRKIAALSSMVGSMTLNSAGGLYAYRSSKAALNAVMRSMSHDLAARGIVAVPVHPGWVRTDMGGPNAQVETDDSARGIRELIAGLDMAASGRFWRYDGEELPW